MERSRWVMTEDHDAAMADSRPGPADEVEARDAVVQAPDMRDEPPASLYRCLFSQPSASLERLAALASWLHRYPTKRRILHAVLSEYDGRIPHGSSSRIAKLCGCSPFYVSVATAEIQSLCPGLVTTARNRNARQKPHR